MSNNLNDAVTELAYRRQLASDRHQAVVDLEEKLGQTPLGKQLAVALLQLAEAKSEVAEGEKIVRAEALQEYQKTGTKKPHPAVTVKQMLVLAYSSDEALRWANEHLPSAIKLDTKLFEKHARAVLNTAPLPFVEVTHEYQTAIASNLAEWEPK